MYTNGIPDELYHQILMAYDETTSNHNVTVNSMLAHIDNHLEQISATNKSPMSHYNEEINNLRLENDRLQREISFWKNPLEPNLTIGFSFKPYLGPLARLKFAVLKAQNLLMFVILRLTTNTAVASNCFHKMEDFRTKARHRAATKSFYKQMRNISE